MVGRPGSSAVAPLGRRNLCSMCVASRCGSSKSASGRPIGEHTGALLGELGYDAATIAELAAEGVVTLGSAADTKTVGTRA